MFEKPNKSTSKFYVDLLNGVSYQPNFGYVAGYEANTERVIFWEKNGLRHLEFDLPKLEFKYDFINICWSPDSQILALHLRFQEPAKPNQTSSTILLYVRSNF